MINAATIGLAVGTITVLGMTGLLVYAGVRKQARYVWKRALALDVFGTVLLVGSVVYLVAQIGPCNNIAC